jgi:hypothetical protein
MIQLTSKKDRFPPHMLAPGLAPTAAPAPVPAPALGVAIVGLMAAAAVTVTGDVFSTGNDAEAAA